MAEIIENPNVEPVSGSVGLATQVPGQAATVSGAALATGGIATGNFVQPDIDQQLYAHNSDDTPLMQMMLQAKKVTVNSPEVQHWMVDEPKAVLHVDDNGYVANGSRTAILPLSDDDGKIPQEYFTLLVKGVNGYDEYGQEQTNQDLMLFVKGRDTNTDNPIVMAVNGPKANRTDAYCTIPSIPAGATIVVLSNALYETQKQVAPDLVVPTPMSVYLQKRAMNQVISDYFEAQKKAIPFGKAVLAEQAITQFKTKSNRTLWAGRKSKFTVDVPKLGPQTIYTTEGLRWQFKREVKFTGSWTIEKLIRLAKMFFTGEDVPKSAICLCGKDFLENIQCIDFRKHPEIQVTVKTNYLGWSVTNIHTVFGDFEFKREPTLDRLGWSKSAALIGEDRLVRYTLKNESSFNEDIEGEEAKRNGLIVWDAIALKGTCHIWVDGEGNETPNDDVIFTDFDNEIVEDIDDNTTGGGEENPGGEGNEPQG